MHGSMCLKIFKSSHSLITPQRFWAWRTLPFTLRNCILWEGASRQAGIQNYRHRRPQTFLAVKLHGNFCNFENFGLDPRLKERRFHTSHYPQLTFTIKPGTSSVSPSSSIVTNNRYYSNLKQS